MKQTILTPPWNTGIVLVFFLFCSTILEAQLNFNKIAAVDTQYNALVKSISIRENNDPVFLPILHLNKSYQLQVHFDLMEGTPRQLFYGICHYNKDWTMSDLQLLEYLDGFTELQIQKFRASSQTYTPYVHYQLTLPSADMSFRVTGNFMLAVYDNTGEVYFTRKFYVTDNSFRATPRFINPVDPEKVLTHQSISLIVSGGQSIIYNPGLEVQIEILQNGNPMTKKILTEPLFFSGNQLNYTKQDGILFPGMKEYRRKDLRSIQHKTLGISYWDEKDNEFHCYFKPEESRLYKNYHTDFDFNGRVMYALEDDYDASSDYRSEYVWAHAKLQTNVPSDHAVYLYGALTDWKLKQEFRMEYDETERAYSGTFYIKNAVFDYMYATTDDDGKITTSFYEGDWYETENDYLIMVYYRPFGTRYDRLVFAGRFNSNKQ